MLTERTGETSCNKPSEQSFQILLFMSVCLLPCTCVCVSLQDPPYKLQCGNTRHFSESGLQLFASSLFHIIFEFCSFFGSIVHQLAHSGFQLQVRPVLIFCSAVFPFVLARNSVWMVLSHNLPGGLINSPLLRFHLHCLP